MAGSFRLRFQLEHRAAYIGNRNEAGTHHVVRSRAKAAVFHVATSEDEDGTEQNAAAASSADAKAQPRPGAMPPDCMQPITPETDYALADDLGVQLTYPPCMAPCASLGTGDVIAKFRFVGKYPLQHESQVTLHMEKDYAVGICNSLLSAVASRQATMFTLEYTDAIYVVPEEQGEEKKLKPLQLALIAMAVAIVVLFVCVSIALVCQTKYKRKSSTGGSEVKEHTGAAPVAVFVALHDVKTRP